MRSAEVLEAVRARFGPTVTALRLSLAGARAGSRAPDLRAVPPPRPRRGSTPTSWPWWKGRPRRYADEALASTVRRIMAKGLIARRGGAFMACLLVAGALAGCATAQTSPAEPPDHHDRPARPPAGATCQGEAYYHYVDRPDGGPRRAGVAGRDRPSCARPSRTIPNTAVLVDPALPVADPHRRRRGRHRPPPRRPSRSSPTSATAHMTLADLYRRQRKPAEAEARAGAGDRARPADAGRRTSRSPSYHVEQKSYDKARAVLQRLVDRAARISSQALLPARAHRASRPSSGTRRSSRLRRAIELDPDHDGAWSALGFVYESAATSPTRRSRSTRTRSRRTRTTRPSWSGWATCSCARAARARRRARSSRSSSRCRAIRASG